MEGKKRAQIPQLLMYTILKTNSFLWAHYWPFMCNLLHLRFSQDICISRDPPNATCPDFIIKVVYFLKVARCDEDVPFSHYTAAKRLLGKRGGLHLITLRNNCALHLHAAEAARRVAPRRAAPRRTAHSVRTLHPVQTAKEPQRADLPPYLPPDAPTPPLPPLPPRSSSR